MQDDDNRPGEMATARFRATQCMEALTGLHQSPISTLIRTIVNFPYTIANAVGIGRLVVDAVCAIAESIGVLQQETYGEGAASAEYAQRMVLIPCSRMDRVDRIESNGTSPSDKRCAVSIRWLP